MSSTPKGSPTCLTLRLFFYQCREAWFWPPTLSFLFFSLLFFCFLIFFPLFCSFLSADNMQDRESFSLNSLTASSVHFPLFIFHFLLRYRVPDLVCSPGFCSVTSIQAYHNSTQVRLALTASGMAGITCLGKAHQHVHRIHIALVLDVAACIHQEVMSVTRPGSCTHACPHSVDLMWLPDKSMRSGVR